MKRIRVAVVYGGRSGEHEISLQSAASVLRNLDREQFEIVPVGIDKEGHWHLNDLKLLEKAEGKALPLDSSAPAAVLPPAPSAGAQAGTLGPVDVVFPVMHGPLCEDGAIQGLFELADVAYVGSGVLGSAVGMDKDVAKRLAAEAGLPIVPYVPVRRGQWRRGRQEWEERIRKELDFPVFVKPANMGSSVGVHKVKSPAELPGAMDDAFRYDLKVIVERGVNAREIEFAVLEAEDESEEPMVSVPGEIEPVRDFYSYEAKYVDAEGARLLVPARLDETEVKKGQELARRVFTVLECEGLARVDLFVDRDTGEVFFNEVNTMPGFTTISMYPKLWDASGIPYKELLTRLIRLAVARHERRRTLVREHLT